MANEHRGEVAIDLIIGEKQKSFVMRPTFEFVANVESQCGCGIFMLFNRFASDEWRTGDLVAVIAQGIAAAGSDLDVRLVRAAVMEAGPLSFVVPVCKILSNALSGGEAADSGN